MFKQDEKVMVIDIEKVKNDPFLDAEAKRIIESSDFQGIVTKNFTENDKELTCVSFYEGSNRLTQVFKNDEIKKAGE
ncbi:hypothetical protein [Listeria booriae]|nr:hypothetical protein [Listeria booriae]MBC1801067.1 hypothetical protein [Listeria booriae]